MPGGRPRSEAAQNAILAAAREELAAVGYDKLSIDRVATRAGVGKQTVYRRYATKSSLVAECLLQGFVATPTVDATNTNDVRADITAWVRSFVEMTHDTQAAALIRAAGAAAGENKDIARGFQDGVKTLARTSLALRMERAEEASQLRAGTPSSTVAEIIVGSLIYRMITHEEITADFVDELIATIFDGITSAPGTHRADHDR